MISVDSLKCSKKAIYIQSNIDILQELKEIFSGMALVFAISI